MEAAESASSSSEGEDEESGGVTQPSPLLAQKNPDPISLWRPHLALEKPTRHGFEAKNTFSSLQIGAGARKQMYELSK